MYVSVLCELNANDVRFFSGKSRIFYFQRVNKISNENIYTLPLLPDNP